MMMHSYLKRPYVYFLDTNSAEMMRGVTEDINSASDLIDAMFKIFSLCLMTMGIVFFLIMQNPLMALGIIFLAIAVFLIIVLAVKKRTKELGALNKNMLSTGTKTLLNIIQHPDKCFSVCECGNNALSLLPLITEGSIYWSIPVVAYNGDSACDIICNGKEYKDFYEFLESI